MRAIWKGAISFGLVNIPIALYPATRREELSFHLLRGSDLSPINNKRVATADGKEVPWDQIVKGYEYEKGKFIVLKEEDFARVDIEATQTVDITDFVKIEEVSPIFFYKPYFMEPQKGGEKAYALLRTALKKSDKIGIAKVVIRTRQHLAAVKPQGEGLMLELMHFEGELVDVKSFKVPPESAVAEKELKMAQSLIDTLTSKWDPAKYRDDYRQALETVIDEKLKHPDEPLPAGPPKPKTTSSADLLAVLQRSLDHARTSPRNGHPKQERSSKARKSTARKTTPLATRKRSRAKAA